MFDMLKIFFMSDGGANSIFALGVIVIAALIYHRAPATKDFIAALSNDNKTWRDKFERLESKTDRLEKDLQKLSLKLITVENENTTMVKLVQSQIGECGEDCKLIAALKPYTDSKAIEVSCGI